MKNNTISRPIDKNTVLAHLDYSADVYCFKQTSSTNDEAKRLAALGCSHGTLVIAEEQSAGRGRRGRSFFSPSHSGIYMSAVIKPDAGRSGVMYTVAAAVAVRRVLGEYAPHAEIKWVNDVYLGSRKIAGILCEAVNSPDNGSLEYVICGIGVNVSPPEGGFPDDLKEKAGYLCDGPIDRGVLAALLANSLFDAVMLDSGDLIAEYSEHMMLNGRRICYSKNGQSLTGTVRGVDASGGLIVEDDSGSRSVLTSGEVQLEAF